MTTTKLTFRPFNSSDWECYSGAEDLAPGVPPMICETESACYIVDAIGRSAMFYDESPEATGEALSFHTENRQVAWPMTVAQAVSLGWECLAG